MPFQKGNIFPDKVWFYVALACTECEIYAGDRKWLGFRKASDEQMGRAPPSHPLFPAPLHAVRSECGPLSGNGLAKSRSASYAPSQTRILGLHETVPEILLNCAFILLLSLSDPTPASSDSLRRPQTPSPLYGFSVLDTACSWLHITDFCLQKWVAFAPQQSQN